MRCRVSSFDLFDIQELIKKESKLSTTAHTANFPGREFQGPGLIARHVRHPFEASPCELLAQSVKWKRLFVALATLSRAAARDVHDERERQSRQTAVSAIRGTTRPLGAN